MMVRTALLFLFGGILLSMLAVTTYASLDRGIFDVGSQLLADRWFQATLADAYFGFITFYVWVAYKQQTWWSRALWLVLILALGNIAMAIYMLWQVWQWDPHQGAASLLLRSAPQ